MDGGQWPQMWEYYLDSVEVPPAWNQTPLKTLLVPTLLLITNLEFPVQYQSLVIVLWGLAELSQHYQLQIYIVLLE